MFGERRSSRPGVGELVVAFVVGTLAATAGAALFGHPEAGLIAGPLCILFYYMYIWPPKEEPGT